MREEEVVSCSYQGTEHFPPSHPLPFSPPPRPHISFPPPPLCPPPPPLHRVSGGINNPLLSRLQKNSAEREEEGEKEEERIKEEGNVLNLSHQAQSDVPDDSLRWEHSLWREKYVGLCLMITVRIIFHCYQLGSSDISHPVADLIRTLASPRWGRMTTWTASTRAAEAGGRR